LRSRVRDVSRSQLPDSGTGIFVVQATTRDVSSTLIRERLVAGRSIDDLVPSAVAQHIVAHHLYETEDDLHGQNQDIHG
jgi:nicotinic acid mononucleotide adenylyltransferase